MNRKEANLSQWPGSEQRNYAKYSKDPTSIPFRLCKSGGPHMKIDGKISGSPWHSIRHFRLVEKVGKKKQSRPRRVNILPVPLFTVPRNSNNTQKKKKFDDFIGAEIKTNLNCRARGQKKWKTRSVSHSIFQKSTDGFSFKLNLFFFNKKKIAKKLNK